MTGLTNSLAHFVSGGTAVPEDAARIVRTGFIDTTSTMIAGRNEAVVGIVRESRVLFGAERAAAADADYLDAGALYQALNELGEQGSVRELGASTATA